MTQSKIDELVLYCKDNVEINDKYDTYYIMYVQFGYWPPNIMGKIKGPKKLTPIRGGDRDDISNNFIKYLRKQFNLGDKICGLRNHQWSEPGYPEVIRQKNNNYEVVFTYVKHRGLSNDVFNIVFKQESMKSLQSICMEYIIDKEIDSEILPRSLQKQIMTYYWGK